MSEGLALTTDMMLGQEFLTWLWFRSDNDRVFMGKDGVSFTIEVEQKIAVMGGEGENTETATCSGTNARLAEARRGLKAGKKVHRELVSFSRDNLGFQTMLHAEDITLCSVRLPPIEPDPDADPDAVLLERMYLIELLYGMFECLFTEFMTLRMDARTWRDICRKMSDWIMESN
ncbi:hypothetical protein LJE06_13160 [Bilophila wadsworthia]|jgi:hypothetical protein|uniref:hypothetical protein n=2 Tax=Bilophila wadsworthia TaxID=35833 RepID=UPI001D09E8D9|nr:hypothetical protein [Bilophila wadsworthia]MCB8572040.1 hypothetical protein [Bilophila wadsworthia]